MALALPLFDMWFQKKRPSPFSSWPIVRTKPIGLRYGRAISLFINNWQAHLVTLDVYSDGMIDAWGALDRDLFEAKLRSRWVVTRPKPDQSISVFNFGMANAIDGKWSSDEDDVRGAVNQIIEELNPAKADLLDMQGNDTVTEGRIRRAKFSMPDKRPFHKEGGLEVQGDSVPVLVRADDVFELAQLFVFADGKCRVGPSGNLQPLEQVLAGYEGGSLTNFAPAKSRIVFPGLGQFTTETDFGGVRDEERKKEIRDLHQTLNGEQPVIRRCIAAFRDYQTAPSDAAKQTLRAAYEAVPAHLRRYCGDMDTKDFEIRRVLFTPESG